MHLGRRTQSGPKIDRLPIPGLFLMTLQRASSAMTTCCSLSLSAADSETLPTELRWSDWEARNSSRSMAKPLGFWEPCESVRIWDLGFPRRFTLTVWSWGMCHYVIWNTGIMSRRTCSLHLQGGRSVIATLHAVTSKSQCFSRHSLLLAIFAPCLLSPQPLPKNDFNCTRSATVMTVNSLWKYSLLSLPQWSSLALFMQTVFKFCGLTWELSFSCQWKLKLW